MSKKELNWIGRDNYRFGTCDVSIRLSDPKAKKQNTNFRFRNGCYKKITNTLFMVVAYFENRVYFKESHEGIGVKLTGPAKTNDSLSITISGISEKAIEGDYDLKYDREENLYYIDMNENKIGAK